MYGFIRSPRNEHRALRFAIFPVGVGWYFQIIFEVYLFDIFLYFVSRMPFELVAFFKLLQFGVVSRSPFFSF